jgi:hypothetical protein
MGTTYRTKGGSPGEKVAELLNPFDGAVKPNSDSTRVNNVKNDGPDLVEAI